MAKGTKVRLVVTGIRKIDRQLKLLPLKIQKKIVTPAIKAGLAIMKTAVDLEVPVDTGLTKKNVKIKASLHRKRYTIDYEVRILAEGGLKRTSARTGETVFYPAIVEYLHDPFMHRAFAAYAGAARRVTIDRLKEGVAREIAAAAQSKGG